MIIVYKADPKTPAKTSLVSIAGASKVWRQLLLHIVVIYYIRNKRSINYCINYVHKINPTPVRETLLCKYTSDTDIF